MTNRLRYAIALSALLSVSGCSVSQEQVEQQAAYEAKKAQSQAVWRATNCHASESDAACSRRLQAAFEAGYAREHPEYEASIRRDAQMQADQAECQMNAQMAAANADRGGMVYGAIMGVATGNQVFATCMQMKAAQRAAYGG